MQQMAAIYQEAMGPGGHRKVETWSWVSTLPRLTYICYAFKLLQDQSSARPKQRPPIRVKVLLYWASGVQDVDGLQICTAQQRNWYNRGVVSSIKACGA